MSATQNVRYVYYLPCRPCAIYVNITDSCLNDCLFCIKRAGPVFFGQNLSMQNGGPNSEDIFSALQANPGWPSIEEVVFCGMGEPLMRYDCVLDVSKNIKLSQGVKTKTRVDTSGLHWSREKRLDLLDYIDILSVSLNAETAEKYEEMCQPKITNAYAVLMYFLAAVKRREEERKACGLPFPEVRLSVVDTSEESFIQTSSREGYAVGTFPIPDMEACLKIAESFGWRFVIKRLFRDSLDTRWTQETLEEVCFRGTTPEICAICDHRH